MLATVAQAASTGTQKIATPTVAWKALAPVLILIGGAVLILGISAMVRRKPRSSVFAVWITVGFFEVVAPPSPLPAGVDASMYPDGYALGSELNSDTGDVKRYRAFYIFDRSIPVGFERGQDHNVHKAIRAVTAGGFVW